MTDLGNIEEAVLGVIETHAKRYARLHRRCLIACAVSFALGVALTGVVLKHLL